MQVEECDGESNIFNEIQNSKYSISTNNGPQEEVLKEELFDTKNTLDNIERSNVGDKSIKNDRETDDIRIGIPYDNSDKKLDQGNTYSIEEEIARIVGEEVSHENCCWKTDKIEANLNDSINSNVTKENECSDEIQKNIRNDKLQDNNTIVRCENVIEQEEIDDYEVLEDDVSTCDKSFESENTEDEDASIICVEKESTSTEHSVIGKEPGGQDDTAEIDDENQYDISHLVDVKEVKNLHYCVICQYATPHIGILNRHISAVHNLKPWKCKYCDKNFSRKVLLNKHIRKEHSVDLRKCSYCNFQRLCSGQVMQKHMHKHHSRKVQTVDDFTRLKRNGVKGMFECGKCCYSIRSSELMQSHIKMHDLKYVLRCLYCYFMINDLRTYRNHLADTHKSAKKVFICNKCFFQSEDHKEYIEHKYSPHYSHICPACSFETENIEIFYSHSDTPKGGVVNSSMNHVNFEDDLTGKIQQDGEFMNNDAIVEEDGGLCTRSPKESRIRTGNLAGLGNVIEFEEMHGVDRKRVHISPTRPSQTDVLEPNEGNLSGQFDSTTPTPDGMVFHEHETYVTVHYRCPGCSLEMGNGSIFIGNSENYPEEKPNLLPPILSCPFCEFQIGDQISINSQLEDVSQKGQKDFPDVSKQTIAYVIKENFEKSYCCTLCSFSNPQLLSLKLHLKKEHTVRCLICPRCSDYRYSTYLEHVNQHCPQCQFWSNDSNELHLHVLTHVPKYKRTNCNLSKSSTEFSSSCSSPSNKPSDEFNKCHFDMRKRHSFKIDTDETNAKSWKTIFEIDKEEEAKGIGMELTGNEILEKLDDDRAYLNTSCEEIRIIIDDESSDTSYPLEIDHSLVKKECTTEQSGNLDECDHSNDTYDVNVESDLLTEEKCYPEKENSEKNCSDEEIRLIICKPDGSASSENKKPNFGTASSESLDNIIGKPVRIIKILKHQCFDCLNVYKSRYILVDHRKKLHRLKKPHSCTYCLEIFETYNYLKSHYYREHNVTYHNKGPIFKCPLCDFASILVSRMKKHISKIHHRNAVGFKKRLSIC